MKAHIYFFLTLCDGIKRLINLISLNLHNNKVITDDGINFNSLNLTKNKFIILYLYKTNNSYIFYV